MVNGIKVANKEAVVFVCAAVLCFSLLMEYRAAYFRKNAEIEAKSSKWMDEYDPETVRRIKAPIDNIDWGYYIGQYVTAAADPFGTLDSYFSGEITHE